MEEGLSNRAAAAICRYFASSCERSRRRFRSRRPYGVLTPESLVPLTQHENIVLGEVAGASWSLWELYVQVSGLG